MVDLSPIFASLEHSDLSVPNADQVSTYYDGDQGNSLDHHDLDSDTAPGPSHEGCTRPAPEPFAGTTIMNAFSSSSSAVHMDDGGDGGASAGGGTSDPGPSPAPEPPPPPPPPPPAPEPYGPSGSIGGPANWDKAEPKPETHTEWVRQRWLELDM